ncbi:oxidoreductase DltE [Apiospora arundinis]
MSSFPYKNVVVVGATSGIGLALSERLIENGIFVIGVGRRKERLDEFVSKHGSDKCAASQFDITNLDGIKFWVEDLLKQHPNVDAVVLNSGIQRTLDFTKPQAIDLTRVHQEITTNYTSYISLLTHFLPHLQSRAPEPAAVVAVTSGLAVVPMPRCGNYCATKAALHSLLWSVRAQLAADPASQHVKVVEILPPAVQTELHSQQPDLVARGLGDIGITLQEFTDEAWAGLTRGDDEIPVGPRREQTAKLEEGRREAFKGMVKTVGTT